MTEPVANIIGAFVGGLFGASCALIGAWLTHMTAERKRADAADARSRAAEPQR